ncbi:MAG: ExbD/TolR family protein, partial [Saprospiraceae bacterium]
MQKKKRRLNSEVNAGSMADIAFLLLIFFLVTTQIDFDKGILVKLPMWEKEPPKTDIPPRNVFSIKVNRANQLLVEGEIGDIEAIRNQVKEFVINPKKKANLSSAPNKAVVSLQNDRGTS